MILPAVGRHETLGIPEAFVDPAAPVLYVATTTEQVKGAGVIAYPGLMEETAEKLGGDSLFLSLPDEWHYSVRGIAAICKEGVDGINSTLQELEKNGYLTRRQTRQSGGRR